MLKTNYILCVVRLSLLSNELWRHTVTTMKKVINKIKDIALLNLNHSRKISKDG